MPQLSSTLETVPLWPAAVPSGPHGRRREPASWGDRPSSHPPVPIRGPPPAVLARFVAARPSRHRKFANVARLSQTGADQGAVRAVTELKSRTQNFKATPRNQK